MRRLNAGGGEGVVEAGDPVGLHPHLVVVVLGNGTEDLQRVHARIAGAAGGHGNAAGVDAVGAQEEHGSGSREGAFREQDADHFTTARRIVNTGSASGEAKSLHPTTTALPRTAT